MDLKDSIKKEFETALMDNREECRLPQSFSSQYRICSCLQYADHKRTYLAQGESDGRKYIIKCAGQEYKAFLKEEAELLRQGEFSFLPHFVGYCEEDGEAYLVREYIEGNTLWDIGEAQGAFPQKEALFVLYRIAGALKQLHGHKPPYIHRDLKPQNIVMTVKEECYLIDMGTARQTGDGKEHDTVIIGTRSVAAPEQFGYSQSDARTDIYAFGILMNYLLTGNMTVEGQGELPDALWGMIQKCVEFDPQRRYQSAGELEEELQAIMTGKKRPNKSRKPVKWALLAAAVLVCVLFGAKMGAGLLDSKVEFPDPLLEKAVRQELGKSDGEVIYKKDLTRVAELLICGDVVFDDYESHRIYNNVYWIGGEVISAQGTIKDISILRDMPNLQILVLDNQGVTDLSPLEDLDLKKVSLCGNPLNDISPLQNSASLTELYIEGTQVSDLSALADKKMLKTLHIAFTDVSSLEPLRDSQISTLAMFVIPCEDYSVLYDLPLKVLYTDNLPADVIERLAEVGGLQRFTAYKSGVTDLKVFAGFSELQELDLWDNHVVSLEGIENLPNLSILQIGENPIEYADIPENNSLTFLGIRKTKIKDFSFTGNLKYLMDLEIDMDQKPYLEEQIPNPNFNVNVWN